MNKTLKTVLLTVLVSAVVFACFFFLYTATPERGFEVARDKAVEIGNDFLDYEITRAEAVERLSSIVVPAPENRGSTFLLKTDINDLIELILDTSSEYEEIEEAVDEIENNKD